ncbi:MAG: Trk family potassium uptake protein [Dehalococcoidia bacterium]|nr:Trk family potassium uptake protein [Dehalococcoidia bacterium]
MLVKRGWSRRLGDRVVRHARQEELTPLHIPIPPLRQPGARFETPLILLFGVGSLIAIGTFLLWLPWFNTTGEFAPFLTALFTATSAATDTGLTVVDTTTFWNPAGRGIIMALILVGGAAVMSATTYLLVTFVQRVSLTNQIIMQEFTGVSQMGGLVRLAVQVTSVALILQFIGFLLLLWRFLSIFDIGQAAWLALFHSISAFNNAGFAIMPESDSLIRYQREPWVLGILALLIILGGISYSVMVDVVRYRRFKRFTLDTRLVLVVTGVLLAVGSLVMFLSEFNNEATLGTLPMADRAVNSLFMSASNRTAGFATIDYALTEIHTNLFVTSLMFVGGASGSMTGGIKVNTLAVLLVAVITSIRGGSQATAFGREIAHDQIQRALAVAFLSITFVSSVAFLLVMTEKLPFDRLLFETFSAFGTVGLTAGVTGMLSSWGQTVIALTMFVGDIGPLTFALALAQRQQHAIFRYSQERVRIG